MVLSARATGEVETLIPTYALGTELSERPPIERRKNVNTGSVSTRSIRSTSG